MAQSMTRHNLTVGAFTLLVDGGSANVTIVAEDKLPFLVHLGTSQPDPDAPAVPAGRDSPAEMSNLDLDTKIYARAQYAPVTVVVAK
jgi:hypothetical protein